MIRYPAPLLMLAALLGGLSAAPAQDRTEAPRAEGVLLGVMSRSGGSRGVLVDAVVQGLPAHEAGIRAGDRLVAFGAATLDSDDSLRVALAATPPGSRVPVRIRRPDGSEETVSVVFGPGTGQLTTQALMSVERLLRARTRIDEARLLLAGIQDADERVLGLRRKVDLLIGEIDTIVPLAAPGAARIRATQGLSPEQRDLGNFGARILELLHGGIAPDRIQGVIAEGIPGSKVRVRVMGRGTQAEESVEAAKPDAPERPEQPSPLIPVERCDGCLGRILPCAACLEAYVRCRLQSAKRP